MPVFTCIECPNGCRLQCEITGSGFTCTGNQCKRGAAYGEAEMTHPVRTLTTTVRTCFPDTPVVSVRTDGAIPKELVHSAVQVLGGLVITKPTGISEVVLRDLLHTGVNVVCTTNLLAERKETRKG